MLSFSFIVPFLSAFLSPGYYMREQTKSCTKKGNGNKRRRRLSRPQTRNDLNRKFRRHRRGITIPAPVGRANRAASSKLARFIRHWRRFADFHVRQKKRLSARKRARLRRVHCRWLQSPQKDGSAIFLRLISLVENFHHVRQRAYSNILFLFSRQPTNIIIA